MAFRYCGLKMSVCGLIFCTWGCLQLALMGAFYYVKSVALLEDIAGAVTANTPERFYEEIDPLYTQTAYNCWIAACLYLVLLIMSAQQFYVNCESAPRT